MVSALESSPSPRIFTGCLVLMTPALRNTSGVMVVSPSAASFSRFTMLNSLRKMLVKPRLGMRRCSGIWPPSKPRIIREPLRERWPLCPRVDVLPMPEPMPRPTRFLPEFAFFGARIFERFIIALRYRLRCRNIASNVSTRRLWLHDLDQVRDFRHHSANGGIVRTLDHLVQSRETQPLDYQLLLYRGANCGTDPFQ